MDRLSRPAAQTGRALNGGRRRKLLRPASDERGTVMLSDILAFLSAVIARSLLQRTEPSATDQCFLHFPITFRL
ncbi:hypothetical protein, partial [uncultured Sphingomonas sp.]|uniref:hypothetical protein n=1 Tax=uncultured Sphingomonas sp. TaxID=158754 RepID=UPI0035CA4250